MIAMILCRQLVSWDYVGVFNLSGNGIHIFSFGAHLKEIDNILLYYSCPRFSDLQTHASWSDSVPTIKQLKIYSSMFGLCKMTTTHTVLYC
jgi:hypothetical protein